METEPGSIGHRNHELDSDSSNAAIDLLPVLPPEMLQSIYKFLPFKDLLVCREVNKKWRSVVTDPLRQRCRPLVFSREDIPDDQCSRFLQSFNELIKATNRHGGLGEFPVTEFHFDLNSDYSWIEIDGSTLISQFLGAVSPFVKHILFDFQFQQEFLQVSNNCLAIPQDLAFPKLAKISLMLDEAEISNSAFNFISKIIEKCPNIKEFHIDVYNVGRSGEIRRFVKETGVEQKTNLVTSLSISALKEENDFQYLTKLGFKLKHFYPSLRQYNGSTIFFRTFLESQSDTLTSLRLRLGNGNSYQYLRQLPCLSHLNNISIVFWAEKVKKLEEKIPFPTLFYKEQLPALKKMDLTDLEFGANYLIASHMAPSESLQELILPQKGIQDAGEFIQQVARLFPNLKKLQVSRAASYMSDIYEKLPGIEELCIITDGRVSVDHIITGLPERVFRKITRNNMQIIQKPGYLLCKALAMVERGTTKSLACLENLKILRILHRRSFEFDDDDIGWADFTELSGVVLKQMKGLRIDFGVRKYGPNVSTALKQDLEAHGIKLDYRMPPYTRLRTDFIESLTESDDSYSGSDTE